MDENPAYNLRIDKDRLAYAAERALLGLSFDYFRTEDVAMSYYCK